MANRLKSDLVSRVKVSTSTHSPSTPTLSQSTPTLSSATPTLSQSIPTLSPAAADDEATESVSRTLEGTNYEPNATDGRRREVGLKLASSVAGGQHMLDALIQEQFNNLRQPSDGAQDGTGSHTKIIKYKDHHRVPNLSKTPPLGAKAKSPSPTTIPPVAGSVVTSLGHQMIPSIQGSQSFLQAGSSRSGKATPPMQVASGMQMGSAVKVASGIQMSSGIQMASGIQMGSGIQMASGIHRSVPQVSAAKSRPGPLSKKMAAMQPPVTSSGIFNPGLATSGQRTPQQLDMNASYEVYHKMLMASMGHMVGHQQQPNVPISINPIVSPSSSGNRPTNHSIEALVSPTVSSSVSSSSILKPAPKIASQPQQQTPANPFPLSFTTQPPSQQQYKK